MTPVPLVRGLLDTPLLLAYREGWPAPLGFMTAIRQIGPPELSAISAMALLAWSPDQSALMGVRAFLAAATVYSITAQVSRLAVRIMDQHVPPTPLTADDAIVAATDLAHKLPLYTLDPVRFAAVPGLTAILPY